MVLQAILNILPSLLLQAILIYVCMCRFLYFDFYRTLPQLSYSFLFGMRTATSGTDRWFIFLPELTNVTVNQGTCQMTFEQSRYHCFLLFRSEFPMVCCSYYSSRFQMPVGAFPISGAACRCHAPDPLSRAMKEAHVCTREFPSTPARWCPFQLFSSRQHRSVPGQ